MPRMRSRYMFCNNGLGANTGVVAYNTGVVANTGMVANTGSNVKNETFLRDSSMFYKTILKVI